MRTKLFKYSIALLTAVLILSCSKVPRGLLPENKMKSIMIDMQIAEQLINENYLAYQDSARKAALFEAIFRKHNIKQAVYDSSLVWYGKNLNIMTQVIDLALKDIDKQIRDLNVIKAAALAAKVDMNKDTANIWTNEKTLILHPKALFNGTIFDIKPIQPDTIFPAGANFVLSMNVWGLRPEMQHWPEIKLAAEMRDSTITINQTIQNDGFLFLSLQTDTTKAIRRIYGYIRMDNAESNYYKIYIDSIKMAKFNYGATLPNIQKTTKE